jgi:hypothetical protein
VAGGTGHAADTQGGDDDEPQTRPSCPSVD